MNILVVSSFLPYPLFSGGHVRLYNLLKGLSRNHSITLVCEIRPHQKNEDIVALKEFCADVIVIPRKKQWSIKNIINTGYTTLPFLVVGHTLPEMKSKIRELLSQKKFDIIHVETSYVMQNIPRTIIPIVLTEHNIEYLVYKRYVATSSVFLRPFLGLDVKKLQRWEENIWRNVSRLVAVSEVEKKHMKRTDVRIVPNGVDVKQFTLKKTSHDSQEKTILFLGDFKWIQNQKSATWILKEIWPKIHDKFNNKMMVKLWIVGKNIPERLKHLAIGNVVFDENAPDKTLDIFHLSDILLAPIQVGGGTSYKILEAMASGIPVVTTTLGNEGIGAIDGDSILVADNASDIEKQTTKLLSDPKLYEKIRKNARILVEQKYDWKIIIEELEQVYKDALKTT